MNTRTSLRERADDAFISRQTDEMNHRRESIRALKEEAARLVVGLLGVDAKFKASNLPDAVETTIDLVRIQYLVDETGEGMWAAWLLDAEENEPDWQPFGDLADLGEALDIDMHRRAELADETQKA